MNFESLPYDCLHYILSQVPLRSLFNVSQTCKQLYQACSEEELWRTLYIRDFGESDFAEGTTWKLLYGRHAAGSGAFILFYSLHNLRATCFGDCQDQIQVGSSFLRVFRPQLTTDRAYKNPYRQVLMDHEDVYILHTTRVVYQIPTYSSKAVFRPLRALAGVEVAEMQMNSYALCAITLQGDIYLVDRTAKTSEPVIIRAADMPPKYGPVTSAAVAGKATVWMVTHKGAVLCYKPSGVLCVVRTGGARRVYSGEGSANIVLAKGGVARGRESGDMAIVPLTKPYNFVAASAHEHTSDAPLALIQQTSGGRCPALMSFERGTPMAVHVFDGMTDAYEAVCSRHMYVACSMTGQLYRRDTRSSPELCGHMDRFFVTHVYAADPADAGSFLALAKLRDGT